MCHYWYFKDHAGFEVPNSQLVLSYYITVSSTASVETSIKIKGVTGKSLKEYGAHTEKRYE